MSNYSLAKEHCNQAPHYISEHTLYQRLRRGMTLEKALAQPVSLGRKIPMSHPYKSKLYKQRIAENEGSGV